MPRPPDIAARTDRLARLDALLRERILVLDGAMGTMIQSHRLNEADYRGTRFADWHVLELQHLGSARLMKAHGFGHYGFSSLKNVTTQV